MSNKYNVCWQLTLRNGEKIRSVLLNDEPIDEDDLLDVRKTADEVVKEGEGRISFVREEGIDEVYFVCNVRDVLYMEVISTLVE